MSEPKKIGVNPDNLGFVRYHVKKQETWYDIVKNQYGIKDNNSVLEVVHKLKDYNNVDYKSSQILSEISLFKTIDLDNGENVQLKGLAIEHEGGETPKKDVDKPDDKKQQGIQVNKNYFGAKTNSLNSLDINHQTKLLEIAQDSIGTIEVKMSEYERLPKDQQQKTNIYLIGNHGSSNDPWCAHTVSYLLSKAGIDFGGHKKAVSAFITWANGKKIYHPISTNKTTKEKYLQERKARSNEIKDQLPHMCEGDLIVWKSEYVAVVEGGSVVETSKSHIGIIESVDSQKGVITVIEGNANEDLKGTNYERSLVHNKSEGIKGAQVVGEWKEVNPRDGIIRKQYTVDELAAFGYSGYIDMSSLIK